MGHVDTDAGRYRRRSGVGWVAPAAGLAALGVLGVTGCSGDAPGPSAMARDAAVVVSPAAVAPTAAPRPPASATPTRGPQDLTGRCPSVETLQGWARTTWVVDAVADSLSTVGECDYLSVPYDATGRTHLENRYVLALTTSDAPADRQVEAFRTAAPRAAGGTVADLEVDGVVGLRHEDRDGLVCQLIVATGERSTLLVLVSDPKKQMDDDCVVAERVAAGLVRTLP